MIFAKNSTDFPIISEEPPRSDFVSESIWDIILIIFGAFAFVVVVFVSTKFCIRDSVCSLTTSRIRNIRSIRREEPTIL